MKKILQFIPLRIQLARALLLEFEAKQKAIQFGQEANNLFVEIALLSGKPIWLEIGSGEKKGTNEWITLDLCDNCDIEHDLRHPLPFPDNSIDKIYASHVLEHFYYDDLMRLLHECLRTLKPGGTLSVSVPDAGIYLDHYNGKRTIDKNKWPIYAPAFHYHTKIDWINYTAYMDNGHRHMFDRDHLIELLKYAGFSTVKPRPFDPKLDHKDRDIESIYALAIK